jgi:hypothetical protein
MPDPICKSLFAEDINVYKDEVTFYVCKVGQHYMLS